MLTRQAEKSIRCLPAARALQPISRARLDRLIPVLLFRLDVYSAPRTFCSQLCDCSPTTLCSANLEVTRIERTADSIEGARIIYGNSLARGDINVRRYRHFLQRYNQPCCSYSFPRGSHGPGLLLLSIFPPRGIEKL